MRRGPFRSLPDPDTHRLAAPHPLLLLLPLLAASLPIAPSAFVATSASPGNVLGAIRLSAPASLTASVAADRTVDLAWPASASAALHTVEYLISRQSAGGPYLDIARTGASGFTDTPGAGTYSYLVRTVASTFTSNDGAFASAVVPP